MANLSDFLLDIVFIDMNDCGGPVFGVNFFGV